MVFPSKLGLLRWWTTGALPDRWILVQLMDSETLRSEVFRGNPRAAAFTAAAATY